MLRISTLDFRITQTSQSTSSLDFTINSLSNYVSNQQVELLSLSGFVSSNVVSLLSLSNYISNHVVDFVSLSNFLSNTNASLLSLSNHISNHVVDFLSLSGFVSSTNASLLSLSNHVFTTISDLSYFTHNTLSTENLSVVSDAYVGRNLSVISTVYAHDFMLFNNGTAKSIGIDQSWMEISNFSPNTIYENTSTARPVYYIFNISYGANQTHYFNIEVTSVSTSGWIAPKKITLTTTGEHHELAMLIPNRTYYRLSTNATLTTDYTLTTYALI